MGSAMVDRAIGYGKDVVVAIDIPRDRYGLELGCSADGIEVPALRATCRSACGCPDLSLRHIWLAGNTARLLCFMAGAQRQYLLASRYV